MKAVIPAAGFGSRMLPLTKSVPKELLPVGDKPIIHHVVAEAVASGISEICIVIRPEKGSIRDYFEQPPARQIAQQTEIIQLEELTAQCKLQFVDQLEPAGLGDAILQAKDFVGAESFAMMIPDQLMLGPSPAVRQLLEFVPENPGAIWTSLVQLSNEEVKFFPGARGFRFDDPVEYGKSVSVGRILPDEEVSDIYKGSPFEVRGFGRTIYPPEIFEYLGAGFVNPETGEVDLLKTFEAATQRLDHKGVLLRGTALDFGTLDSYYHFLPMMWNSDI